MVNLVTSPESKRTGQTPRAIVNVVVDWPAVDQNPTVLPVIPTRTKRRSRRPAHPGRCCRSAWPRTGGADPSLRLRSPGDDFSRDPIGERGGKNLYGLVDNNPIASVDYLGLFDAVTVLDAFRWIREALGESAAAETTNYRRALSELAGVLQRVNFKEGSRGGASAYYRPSSDTVYLSSASSELDILHEMVHAWNDLTPNGITNDRRDEGMAYALEQGVALAGFGIRDLEAILRTHDDPCDRSLLTKLWTTFWENKATPDSYPGGTVHKTFAQDEDFKFDAQDFRNVEAKLGFRIQCDAFAKVLNGILEEGGCCFRFTCENATGPGYIYPGREIAPVFRGQ